MNKNWPTKDKDMTIAQQIMEQYAHDQNSDTLGLFELVVNSKEKRMNFKLSAWVTMLAQHFISIYGDNQGEFVTRQVITRCMIQGQTIH